MWNPKQICGKYLEKGLLFRMILNWRGILAFSTVEPQKKSAILWSEKVIYFNTIRLKNMISTFSTAIWRNFPYTIKNIFLTL